MKYAGVGARRAPPKALHDAEDLAIALGNREHVLRTGAAQGMDQAFMRGCPPYLAEICRPWPSYEASFPDKEGWLQCHTDVHNDAYEIARAYHPNWANLSQGVRKLMARNVYILLGPFLDDYVECVICWTPGGAITGGTGHTLRIAENYNIPVYNLGSPYVTPERILQEIC